MRRTFANQICSDPIAGRLAIIGLGLICLLATANASSAQNAPDTRRDRDAGAPPPRRTNGEVRRARERRVRASSPAETRAPTERIQLEIVLDDAADGRAAAERVLQALQQRLDGADGRRGRGYQVAQRQPRGAPLTREPQNRRQHVEAALHHLQSAGLHDVAQEVRRRTADGGGPGDQFRLTPATVPPSPAGDESRRDQRMERLAGAVQRLQRELQEMQGQLGETREVGQHAAELRRGMEEAHHHAEVQSEHLRQSIESLAAVGSERAERMEQQVNERIRDLERRISDRFQEAEQMFAELHGKVGERFDSVEEHVAARLESIDLEAVEQQVVDHLEEMERQVADRFEHAEEIVERLQDRFARFAERRERRVEEVEIEHEEFAEEDEYELDELDEDHDVEFEEEHDHDDHDHDDHDHDDHDHDDHDHDREESDDE